MPPSDSQATPDIVATPPKAEETIPGVPELRPDLIPNIACSIASGYAGRHYFGGLGGALLGVAIYTVFVKPTVFPKLKK
jgi:hypothetical protein